MTATLSQQSNRRRLHDGLTRFRGPLIVAIAYYLGAEAAFLIGTLSDKIFAPFWPPNAILFCALLLIPRRQWWTYVAAVFPAHVIAELGVGMPATQLAVAFVTNCFVALLNALAVRRLLEGPPWFGSLRKASLYIFVTAIAAPAVSALGGAFVPILGGGAIEKYWTFWGYWYVANALANLTLGPIILTWFADDVKRHRLMARRQQVEAVVIALALVVVSVVAFGLSMKADVSGFVPALLYAPLPLVLWAALRFGARGASTAILIVTVVLVSHSLREPNIFTAADPESNVLALQLFLTGLAVPVLLLGALVDELRRAEQAMRELAGSVLRAQDDERRRVAKELHDSVSQHLAAAGLTAARIRHASGAAASPIVDQLEGALQQSMSELRALSYVLHPPLLDEAGLELALHAYLGRYAERSGRKIDVDIAKDVARLPAETEMVLFRIVQEAVANDAVQAESNFTRVRLARESEGQRVVLTIENATTASARSAPAEAPLGNDRPIGPTFDGLRERLRQLGGRLYVASSAARTVVSAIVPL